MTAFSPGPIQCFVSDEQCKELAFAEYRAEHGMTESVRLGDLPLQAVSEVLDRAQRLKLRQMTANRPVPKPELEEPTL